jgi:hypothetical protein
MLSFKEIQSIERLRLDGWLVTLDDVLMASRHRQEGDAQPWMEHLEDTVRRRGQMRDPKTGKIFDVKQRRPTLIDSLRAAAKRQAVHDGERTGI